MARKRSIDTLPPEVRRWLERALAEANFTGYQQLETLLRDKGFTISKSAIHRYGKALERRLSAVRASTEAAKLLADASPDDQDARSGALTAMIQTELFEVMVNLQAATADDVDPIERAKMLSAVAKNIATLTRSSVNLKRYQADAEQRARRALLEEQREKLAAIGTQGGVSVEALRDIREALGIRA